MTTPTYPCPHCGRVIKNWIGFVRHEPICIRKPEIDAILRQCLRNESTGYMKSVAQYDKNRPESAPSSDTIESQLGPGGWRKLAAIYGLELTPTGRPRKDGTLPVPSGRAGDNAALDAPLPDCVEEASERLRWGLPVCGAPTVAQWIVALGEGLALRVTEERWVLR